MPINGGEAHPEQGVAAEHGVIFLKEEFAGGSRVLRGRVEEAGAGHAHELHHHILRIREGGLIIMPAVPPVGTHACQSIPDSSFPSPSYSFVWLLRLFADGDLSDYARNLGALHSRIILLF